MAKAKSKHLCCKLTLVESRLVDKLSGLLGAGRSTAVRLLIRSCGPAKVKELQQVIEDKS